MAAQVAEPRDACAAHRCIGGGHEILRPLRDRQRRARIVTGLDRQQLGEVAHRARHRAFGAQLGDPRIGGGPIRHAALARSQPEDVIPCRRVAQAAHEVRAIGHRQQPLRQRHRGTAARTPGADARIPCVAGGAKQLVVGVRAEPELRHVGFADHDAAGGLHAFDHHTVDARDGMLQQRAAHRGGKAGGTGSVLDRLRHAVQKAAAGTAGELGVALGGLLQQHLVGREADDGVEVRIDAVDALQVGAHHLDARHLARMDRTRQRVRVEAGEVVAVHRRRATSACANRAAGSAAPIRKRGRRAAPARRRTSGRRTATRSASRPT